LQQDEKSSSSFMPKSALASLISSVFQTFIGPPQSEQTPILQRSSLVIDAISDIFHLHGILTTAALTLTSPADHEVKVFAVTVFVAFTCPVCTLD
jgi:hypothetical protein